MPVGRSLHIGLNTVDPGAYGGWDGELVACEFDARDMEQICASTGLQTQTLLTADATSEAVLAALDQEAATLRDGDLLVVTYAGHGGQMPDENGDEQDHRDETWVLYDRQVLDDELFARWAMFAAGVRIVVVSDSCHSGSVVRAQLEAAGGTGAPGSAALATVHAGGRFMPAAVNDRDNADRRSVYDRARASAPGEDQATLAARVLLLSGCQDNQTSGDGDQNGLFTGTLRTVWKDGAFRGGYGTLLSRIKKQMPPWQTPNYLVLHDEAGAFRTERPFRV